MEEQKRLKVGSYTPETEETEAVIDRDYYRQGRIFKDEEAYLHHPQQVCYVPELSDTAYTRQAFLDLCNGQVEFADECFYAVDWQHPDTWVEEQYREDEWGWCDRCERIYDMSGISRPCPICGRLPDEGEQDEHTESERRPTEPGGI